MLTIERPSGASALIASITPLAGRRTDLGAPNPSALIAILDPASVAAPLSVDLRSIFGLTRREADIAQALVQGLTVAEAATRHGITLSTGRNCLARVLRKTGLNRQAELVQLLNGLMRLTDARRAG